MKKPSFTTGPYVVEPLQADHGASIAICSTGKDARILATIAPENKADDPDIDTAIRGPQDKDNANLFAAAPDLYAAVVALLPLTHFDTCRSLNWNTVEDREANCTCGTTAGRAALALADNGRDPNETEYAEAVSQDIFGQTLNAALSSVRTLHVEVPASINSNAFNDAVVEYCNTGGEYGDYLLDQTGLTINAADLPGLIESDPEDEQIAAFFLEVERIKDDADQVYFHRGDGSDAPAPDGARYQVDDTDELLTLDEVLAREEGISRSKVLKMKTGETLKALTFSFTRVDMDDAGEYFVTVNSSEFGAEEFQYDSRKEAQEGLDRLKAAAAKLNDGIQRHYMLTRQSVINSDSPFFETVTPTFPIANSLPSLTA